MNLGTMQTRCANRFRDPGMVIVTATLWLEHLNEAVDRWTVDVATPFSMTLGSVVFAANDRSKALPLAGIVDVESVRDTTANLPIRPLHSWADVLDLYPIPTATGTPQHYLMFGTSIYLFPVPSAAITLEVSHRNDPTPMAISADTPTGVPSRYHGALCEWALYLAFVDDENLESAGAHRKAWDEWADRANNEMTERSGEYPVVRDVAWG